MEDFALNEAERALFRALTSRGVRFLVIGMGAALIEGADGATQDLDIWVESVTDPRLPEVARDAGGFWVAGFGMQPPAFGGAGLDRIDVVLTAHGLDEFGAEWERAHIYQIDGVTLRVLPLERVIVSKRATGRAKDLAQLPTLEAARAARNESEDVDGSP